MHDCVIGAGAVVDRAVLDKQVSVGPGSRVGWGDEPAAAVGSSGGVTVIGKGTRVPEGSRIGRGCLVAPDLDEHDWPGSEVAAGTAVQR
jgi:glucose-1-phosphate adenylyltransferase